MFCTRASDTNSFSIAFRAEYKSLFWSPREAYTRNNRPRAYRKPTCIHNMLPLSLVTFSTRMQTTTVQKLLYLAHCHFVISIIIIIHIVNIARTSNNIHSTRTIITPRKQKQVYPKRANVVILCDMFSILHNGPALPLARQGRQMSCCRMPTAKSRSGIFACGLNTNREYRVKIDNSIRRRGVSLIIIYHITTVGVFMYRVLVRR